MSHFNHNQLYQPSRGSSRDRQGDHMYRPQYYNQYHNGQWQVNSTNQDWTNIRPSAKCIHFDTNSSSDSQYWTNDIQQQSGWDSNYPPQDQEFYNCSRPQRDKSYQRDRNYNHKKHQSNYSEWQPGGRYAPYSYPYKQSKLESDAEDWNNGTSNQNPQNQTSDHTECNNESPLKTLLQTIRTKRRYWSSKHRIQDVWYSKESTNDNKIDNNNKRLNTSTKVKNDVATNSLNVQVKKNAIIVDLTTGNDDALRQDGTSKQRNLHDKGNKIVNTVREQNNTQEALQNKNISVSNANLQFPKLVLGKSSGNMRDWSVKNPTKRNEESSVISNSSRTDMIEQFSVTKNNNLNPTNTDQSTLSASSNSVSKTKVLVSDQNQPVEQHEIVHRKESSKTIMIMASSLYEQDIHCLSSAVPVTSNILSLPNNDANPVPSTSTKEVHNTATLKSTAVPANSEYKEKAYKSGPLCSKLVFNQEIENRDTNLSNHDDSSNKEVEISDTDSTDDGTNEEVENSDTDLSTDDDTNEEVENSDTDLSIDDDNSSISSEASIAEATDYDKTKSSAYGLYGRFSPASEESDSSLKRKNQDEEPEVNLKRLKIMPENARVLNEEIVLIPDVTPYNSNVVDGEIIEISSDEANTEEVHEATKSPPTLQCSSTSIMKIKSKVLQKKIKRKNPAQAISTLEMSKGCRLTEDDSNFASNHQKLSNMKSTKRVKSRAPQEGIKRKNSAEATSTPEMSKVCRLTGDLSIKFSDASNKKLSSMKSRKSVENRPLPMASKVKIKQITSSSVKKRAATTVEKVLPTSNLPSQQEGKLRNIVNNKKPVVLLKRLTPVEILKFSARDVDKNTLLYQKDVFNQLKYFVNFIHFYGSKDPYKVSLVSEVNDPKDICNKILHISNEEVIAFVKIKYLKKNSDHCRITYKTLSNIEFDIRQIYREYLDCRKNFKQLNTFSILTNLDLSIEAFENNGVKVEHKNGRYTFSVKDGHELHKKFLQCLTLPKLAGLIAQCIEQGKQTNFNTVLIKKYHLALVKENVFVICTKKGSTGRQTWVAKFHPNFLSQKRLSNGAKELYLHLSKILYSHKPLPTMEFVLTNDGFGKDVNLVPYPEVDFRKVADALVHQEQHKLLASKNDLKKIMGHILQKEESNIFGISRQFSDGIDLPGNLNKLRMQVESLLKHEKKAFSGFCNSKISIKDFCNDHPVQKLPDENSEELFENFFKCFAFEKTEKHTLVEVISEINDEACMNAVQEELLRRIRIQSLGEQCWVSIKNLVSKHKVTNALCKQLQPVMNIEFDKKVLDTLQKQVPKNDIVLCLTKCLSLTLMKVKQLCNNVFKFRDGIESLFITNKILVEMKSDVFQALAHSSTNLLVIQWSEPMKKDSQVQDIFTELVNLVKDLGKGRVSMKSIIVVEGPKNCLSITNIISRKIIDNKHSFHLSEDSKAKLLQAENVSLQCRRLSLKPDLLLDEHVATLLESPEILCQFLFTGKLSIGKDLIRPDGYKETHFKPQIKQCIIINPTIFEEQIKDVFIIRNIDRKDLEQYLPARQKVFSPTDVPASMRINARFILLGFNISVSFFDSYAEKNQDHSVHLLRYECGSFVWEKTKGNNKDLLRNRLEDTEDLYKSQKTENVVEAGPKTVIICGESGSGKSVCLYNLTKETKHLYRNGSITDAYWPVQVDLDKKRLSKHAKIGADLKIAIERDFVAKFLCNYLELDEVQSKLLTMIFHNELKIKLVLFFDSYEELPPSHRNFVIQLLQELQVSYCEKIYVTSTPSTRSQLEDALAVFAYTLEFSEVEKIQFLQSFWSKSVGDIELTNEAGSFIDYYSRSRSNDDDLTTTPLHLKMLVAMHKHNDDDYTAIEDHHELYKLYVEHKGVKDDESASLYSLHKILDKEQLRTLNLHHKYAKKGFVLPDDLHHHSFYEYFSAKWLATRNHSPTIAKCINDLLDSALPLFLKIYLAQLDNSDVVKVVGDFAANGHLNVVKTMLTHSKAKLSLLRVIESDNPNAHQVVKFLLDHYNDTKDEVMLHGEFKKPKYAESSIVRYANRREKTKKETPLEAAARLKNIPIACELLLKGANIRDIDKEFVFEIAQYIANEMCKSGSEWLRPIAEKLFKLQPGAVANLNKTKEYPRLLSYFFTHGRVELVNLLLKNDRNRYNILEAEVDGKSPLDLVNESRVLSDDERLEIAKYIVSNVGKDLERKNRHYLVGVLKKAAECSHERTFEYFIGKYPDKHMGFLESAMKNNRLDLIRFLMRKTDRMMYPEDNTVLHKAVSLGVSPITINFLVNRGGIDNKNKSGETPLCIAFKESQDFELIEYLIKKDAHLYAKDELGLYPWCYAILDESKYTSEEQVNIMKYLLHKEVKLKAPETEQKISFESDQKRKEVARKLKFFQKLDSFMLPNLELHVALKSNDESWIRFLILQGANVNHKEADGQTPLHVAIEFKRYKLAKILLDHGAMFNAKDKNKITPLKLLSASGDESKESKEIKDLLENATELFNNNIKYSATASRHLLNSRDKNGQTLLHIAAKNGNKIAIREIIKHSKDHCISNKGFPPLDVNAKDANGNTPLNVVKSNNVDVAKELLVNGAIFEHATTPLLKSAEKLIQAVKDKDVENVKELIKNDCLVNPRDESGKSCLHWAASYNSREIMELLLTARTTDVDAMDLNLKTPLHYAAQNDNIASVVLLLKAGASYDAKNKQGSRPFDVDDKNNESLKLLMKIHQMFVDIKSDEPRIFVNENPDALVGYLLEIDRTWNVQKDIVVNVVDHKKNTLLHIATRYDFTSVVENLLRQGAIYDRLNKWKKSPESMAISTKLLFKMVKKTQQTLSVDTFEDLDPELVVNFRSNNGYTLLHDCVSKGKEEEVRWLIENGADVKATSNRGKKIICDGKKHPAIFEMLEEL